MYSDNNIDDSPQFILINGFDMELLHWAPSEELRKNTHLVIAKPDPFVSDGEGEDVVDKRLAFGVVLRCTKYL